MAKAAVRSKAVVLLLLTFCLLLLPLWESVIVLCFVVRYFMSILHSSITIILMGKRELVALLNLSSWCLVMVEQLFLALPRGCLRFVIVVFPDHTHLLFFIQRKHEKSWYVASSNESLLILFKLCPLVQKWLPRGHVYFIGFYREK